MLFHRSIKSVVFNWAGNNAYKSLQLLSRWTHNQAWFYHRFCDVIKQTQQSLSEYIYPPKFFFCQKPKENQKWYRTTTSRADPILSMVSKATEISRRPLSSSCPSEIIQNHKQSCSCLISGYKIRVKGVQIIPHSRYAWLRIMFEGYNISAFLISF